MWRPSMFHLIPEPLLLLLLSATTGHAQSQTLAVNSSLLFTPANATGSSLALPQSSTGRLTVSVALCGAVPSGGQETRFFATNDTNISDPGLNNIGPNVLEILVGLNGQGNITLENASGGGFFSMVAGSDETFEVGISDVNGMSCIILLSNSVAHLIHSEPLFETLPSLPLLGDTTSNQVLLFSPPFQPTPMNEPSFPNYTFPDANLTAPDPPSNIPTFTLFLGNTSALPSFDLTTNSFADGTPATACALKNLQGLTMQNSSGDVQESLVLRDNNGWRAQWLVNGLTPLTNYTAFVLQDNTKVAGPIYFLTKSGEISISWT